MVISEVMARPVGEPVEFLALVSDLQVRQMKAGGSFTSVVVSDASGTLQFPVWDAGRSLAVFPPGTLVRVGGTRDVYNGVATIRSATLVAVSPDGHKPEDFLPRYETEESQLDAFLAVLRGLEQPWRRASECLLGIDLDAGTGDERWERFLKAPAALRHHGNRIGGLFQHVFGIICTLRVVMNGYRVKLGYVAPALAEQIDPGLMVFCAVAHDIGKLYDYEWSKGCLMWNEATRVSHEGSSLWLTQRALQEANVGYVLEQRVLAVIASHHGEHGLQQPKTAEEWLFHLCDCLDGRLVQCAEAGAA